MTVAEQFGERLRLCRKRALLSQERLAFMAKVHRTEIGLLETGKRSPGLKVIVKLAHALGMTPSELLDGVPSLALSAQDRGDGRYPVGDA